MTLEGLRGLKIDDLDGLVAARAKTLGMCEGLAAHLDPNFRMTEAITPYVTELVISPPPDATID